jgi:hypothetical protein
MKKSCMSFVACLLLSMLVMAMTGCGANSRALNGDSASGSVTAKLVIGKGAAAKAVASTLPSGIASLQFTVTGTDATGKAIPVVRNTITQTDENGKGTVTGIYPGQVTVAVKALAADGSVTYEGFALNVAVASGPTPADAGTIVLSPPLTKPQDANCVACHETTLDVTGQNLVADFKQSGHYANQSWTDVPRTDGNVVTVGTGCAGCHGPSHNDTNPAASGRCFACHGPVGLAPAHKGNAGVTADVQYKCDNCHNAHNTTQMVAGGCTVCHAVGQNATSAGNYVNDNNGVRAITTEFGKWSHHVTGVTLNDAHCVACHLEGTVNAYGLVAVDGSKHMADNKTHLRNADTDADMQWDPAAPSFSTLDNFCLSCHDGNGATSDISKKLQNYINTKGIVAAGKTAGPLNPFGDTISNQYDKLQRTAVVDAAGQFATGNNSHHAVLGKKYSGRTRTPGSRSIDSVAFAGNSSAAMPGVRSTIYDAGKFNATYTTLADAAGEAGTRNGGSSLGDDSTLHCADCHTVGQYRAADVGVQPYNNAVIGAHGSNNEYLLRNNAGTDAKHTGVIVAGGVAVAQDGTKPYLVCFNCHNVATYSIGTHINEHNPVTSPSDCNGNYNTNAFSNLSAVGAAGRLPSRYNNPAVTTGAGAFGTKASSSTKGSNIFGIQCAACHNSGLDNGFGGIHGSKIQTYTDALGNTTKARRFLPGIVNTKFVPGTKGGWSGGTVTVYKNYSGNRNGTGTGKTSGQTFSLMPVRNTPYTTAGYTGKAPSFEYITGGSTNDLNWEQRYKQSVAGQTDPVANAMGCYTLSQNTGLPKVNLLQSAGYPADDVRYSAAEGQTAVDGQKAYGTWGQCTDHSEQAGSQSHSPTRNVLRPVSY